MKKNILVFIGTLVSVLSHAQVRGVVMEKDNNGNMIPMPGVVVYWCDRSFARSTNADGSFEIPVSGTERRLAFSMVGYRKDTLLVTDTLKAIHHMMVKGVELKEVVVSEKQRTQIEGFMDPRNISTITQTGLKQAACCNLAESFENSAAVDVSYADAVTGAKQIQMLGLTGLYTQILTENIPSVRALSAPFGMTYIPGPWMDAIQVSKGTSSVRSGYEGLSGQINVEFKKPLPLKELYHFNVFLNSEQRWEANAIVNTKINDKLGTSLMFNTNQYANRLDENGDGFMDFPMVQSYNITNRYKYEGENFESVSGFKILEETRVGGQTNFSLGMPRDTMSPYGIYVHTRRQEAFFKGGYIYPNREGTSTAIIVSAVNHLQESFYGMKNYNAHHQGIFTNLIHSTYLFDTRHLLTAGMNFVADVYDEHLDSLNLSRTEFVTGAYAEYEFKPSDKFSVITGGRYDYNSRFGSLVTPRAHMRYAPFKNTVFKLSAGKGYRSPNTISDNAFVLASSRKIMIDETVRMEEAWNYGVNLTQKFVLFNRKGSISGDAYRTDFINQWVVDLEQSAREIHFYNLDGKSYANSYQAQIDYSFFKGFDFTMAYRMNDVKTTYNGVLKDKPLVSRNKGFINLNYATPNDKWQFNYTVQMNGGGRIPPTQDNPVQYQVSERFQAYNIMNAQILYIAGNWEFYAGCENLTNFKMQHPVIASDAPYGQYFDATLIWGPLMGRKYYGGLRYTMKGNEKDMHGHQE